MENSLNDVSKFEKIISENNVFLSFAVNQKKRVANVFN